MNKVYADEKPSLEELSHHGVKGQRWGVRNRSMNRASRQKDRATRRRSADASNRIRNKQIDEARVRVRSGVTRSEFKAAKKQFRADKKTIGTREARKKLNVARLKRQTDLEKANQIKSGAETAGHIIGAVGGLTLAALAASGAANRGTRRPSI